MPEDQVTIKQVLKRHSPTPTKPGAYVIKYVIEGGPFALPGMDLAALAIAYEALEKALAENHIEPGSVKIELEDFE